MKLLFRQRAFSWFDSYDIYDENENTVYVVKGQLSWGHCLKIYDPEEQQELGTVKEEILTWLPKFELYEGETCIGTLKKELTFFKPKYNIDFNGWHVEGDVFEWDYTITGPDGGTVAAGDVIPCIRVHEETIFETEWSAANTGAAATTAKAMRGQSIGATALRRVGPRLAKCAPTRALCADAAS